MSGIKQEKSLYARLFSIAIPLALQNLIVFGVGFMDNVMVSSLGDEALSGVFLSNQVQNILQMLSAGIGAALVVLGAQYLGREDKKNAKAVIAIAMQTALIIGALCTVLVGLFPRQVLGLFTNEAAVIDQGMSYIRIVCFSYVFYCAGNVLTSAMRSVQNARVGLLCAITGFVVNVGLNWVLIFGKLGFPALGVRGAAIATLIARICEFGVAAIYAFLIDKKLHLRVTELFGAKLTIAADFFRYGAPVILGDVLWGIGGATQVAILGRLGAEVLAANTIAGNLHQVLGVMVYGLANASGVIIGHTVGAGDYDLVKRYAKKLQVVFLISGVCTGLLVFFSKEAILGAAYRGISDEAYGYAVQFLTVLSVTIVGTAYQMSVLTGIVRAGGATNFVLINDLIFVWLVVIPSALVAAFWLRLPPVVVFACLKCDQVLKCAVAVVKVNRWDWMRKLTRDKA